MIQVDAEGQKQIQALCDVALKVGGIQNLPHINLILATMKTLPPQGKEVGTLMEPIVEDKK